MARHVCRLILLCTVLPRPLAAAPPRAGGEFRANTYTTGNQNFPAVAAGAAGRFVVAWESVGQDGDNGGIFGQRYDRAGATVGGEFQVSVYTTNRQSSPAVAIGPAGEFVVVWAAGGGQDGSDLGIFGRHFDAGGNPLGGEFLVNQYTLAGQFDPSIGADAAGGFVVVWANAGSGQGIHGRRFDSALAGGAEFGISAYTTLVQAAPALAVNPDGSFVATWSSFNQDGDGWGVFGRRFNATDQPLTGEFAVSTYTTGDQDRSQVALTGGGAFTVVWQSEAQDGADFGIFGRRFDATGPLGAEFATNAYTSDVQQAPDVAPDRAGGFVVTWESWSQDGQLAGVFGRSFDGSGAALDPAEFLVNTYTTSNQRAPAIASDPDGRFVVVWGSTPQGESSYSVRGQRFGDLIFEDGFE